MGGSQGDGKIWELWRWPRNRGLSHDELPKVLSSCHTLEKENQEKGGLNLTLSRCFSNHQDPQLYLCSSGGTDDLQERGMILCLYKLHNLSRNGHKDQTAGEEGWYQAGKRSKYLKQSSMFVCLFLFWLVSN